MYLAIYKIYLQVPDIIYNLKYTSVTWENEYLRLLIVYYILQIENSILPDLSRTRLPI